MADGPVLVTGAGGLVGSAVATHLSAGGVTVVGSVRSQRATAEFRTLPLDLEASDAVLAAFTRISPMAVVHCAAVVPAPARYPDDDANAEATRRMDDSVVEACAALGCRLIYVSSCILYDPSDASTNAEGARVRAATPYARAKLAGERQAATLGQSVVMRLSSPVGTHARHGSVFDRFVERALSGQPLEVWGSGRREQDFIHVSDIAEFARLALSGTVSGVFNVASGSPIAMRELAERVVAAVGNGSVTSSAQPDPLENHTARYVVEAAQLALGWTPRVGLEAMIDERVRSLTRSEMPLITGQ